MCGMPGGGHDAVGAFWFPIPTPTNAARAGDIPWQLRRAQPAYAVAACATDMRGSAAWQAIALLTPVGGARSATVPRWDNISLLPSRTGGQDVGLPFFMGGRAPPHHAHTRTPHTTCFTYRCALPRHTRLHTLHTTRYAPHYTAPPAHTFYYHTHARCRTRAYASRTLPATAHPTHTHHYHALLAGRRASTLPVAGGGARATFMTLNRLHERSLADSAAARSDIHARDGNRTTGVNGNGRRAEAGPGCSIFMTRGVNIKTQRIEHS